MTGSRLSQALDLTRVLLRTVEQHDWPAYRAACNVRCALLGGDLYRDADAPDLLAKLLDLQRRLCHLLEDARDEAMGRSLACQHGNRALQRYRAVAATGETRRG